MLDGEYVIVTHHLQRGDEVAPEIRVVAVAHGAENPGAVSLIAVRLSVEHTVDLDVDLVQARVLGVDVEHRFSQPAHRPARIDPLPEHVAGIEVAADGRPCRLAQPQHSFGIIDHETRVHFDGDLHAMVFRKLSALRPVGNDFLLPLPFQDFLVVGRPGCGRPVGIFGIVRIAWAAGEVDDARDT